MPSNLTDISSWNPNYTISIFGTDEQGNVLGGSNTNGTSYAGVRNYGILSPLPEEFSLETNAQWSPLLEGILRQAAGAIGGRRGEDLYNAVAPVAQAAGISLTSQFETQQLWQSTSPIVFNLPLRFNAISDVVKDVSNPILQLLALTLPSHLSSTSLFLAAPGPTLSPNSKYHVHVAIGGMFLFDNVIIKAVQTNFTTLPASSGDFVYADVNLTIETSTILTKADFQKAYIGGGAQAGNNRDVINAGNVPNNAAGVGAAVGGAAGAGVAAAVIPSPTASGTEDAGTGTSAVPPPTNDSGGASGAGSGGSGNSASPSANNPNASGNTPIQASNTAGNDGLAAVAAATPGVPTATQQPINPPSETDPAPLGSSPTNPSTDDNGRVLPNQNAVPDSAGPGLPTTTTTAPDGSSTTILNNPNGTTTQVSTDINGNSTSRTFNANGTLIPTANPENPPSTPMPPAASTATAPIVTSNTDANGFTTTTTTVTNPDGSKTITAANVSGSTTITYSANNTVITPAVTTPSTVINNANGSTTYIAPNGTQSVAVQNPNGTTAITVTTPNTPGSVTTPSNITAQTAANPTADIAASTTNNQPVDLPKTSITNNSNGSQTLTQTTLAGTTTTILNADGSSGLPVFTPAQQIQVRSIYSVDPNNAAWVSAQNKVAGLQPIALSTYQQQQLAVTGQVSLTTAQQQVSATNDALIALQQQNTNALKLSGLPPTASAAPVPITAGR